jgi:hypothetical protein
MFYSKALERDLNNFCSTHVTIDKKTGQTESHKDLFNPSVPLPIPSTPFTPDVSSASIPLHIFFDAIPDFIYDHTGMYLLPPGRSLCQ